MKILIASPIDSDAIDILRERHDVVCAFNASDDELRQKIYDREALVFRSGVSITGQVMACAPDLKLLVRAGSGLDNLDLDYTRAHDLKLVRIPGPSARAVAELTFALMLNLARQVLVADSMLRQGRWAKYELKGHLLVNKTLGIVGAGNIGSRVGQMATAWGMNVIGCVEYPALAIETDLREKGIRLTGMDEVLATSDFVSLHLPLTDVTRGIIGSEALSRMKPAAFLINMARGGVVDESALYKALVDGNLTGAALDVHRDEGENKVSPLAQLSNVILTPHIGATTLDTQREIGKRIVEIVNEFWTEQMANDPALDKVEA